MSFYSYKNANASCSPGSVTGNICQGLNEKICIQVKNVYDACLQQEQLDEVDVTVTDIVPVLPDPCACRRQSVHLRAMRQPDLSGRGGKRGKQPLPAAGALRPVDL